MANNAALVESKAAPVAPPPGAAEELVIATRFGTFAFDRGKAIVMPRGLIGFAEHHEYALADLADARFPGLMLLQCLSAPELSFLVAHYDRASAMIEPADLEEATNALGVAVEDTVVLLIVSVRRTSAGAEISVNLRAPLIVAAPTRRAWQHVLANASYSVRHPITPASATIPSTDTQPAAGLSKP